MIERSRIQHHHELKGKVRMRGLEREGDLSEDVEGTVFRSLEFIVPVLEIEDLFIVNEGGGGEWRPP